MDTFGTLIAGIAVLNACGLAVAAFAERRIGQNSIAPLPDAETQEGRPDRSLETVRFRSTLSSFSAAGRPAQW